jgi:hypothetical protein
MAGFSFKTLCFCEPFVYHAWPFEYRITFDDEIIGICAISSGVLVVTKQKPYIVTGVHPSSMATIPLDANFTLAYKRTLVDMGAYAIFAAPEGLVKVEGTNAELLTADMFTFDQWQTIIGDPHDDPQPLLTAGQFEGKYVLWTAPMNRGLIFDPRGEANTLVYCSQYFQACYYEPLSDALWIRTSGGTATNRFARSSTTNLPYTWKSKIFLLDKPTALACFRLETWEEKDSTVSPDMSVVVDVWADDIQVVTGRILGTLATDKTNYVFRLPAGARAKRWQFQLSGQNPITRFGMFESMESAE